MSKVRVGDQRGFILWEGVLLNGGLDTQTAVHFTSDLGEIGAVDQVEIGQTIQETGEWKHHIDGAKTQVCVEEE